MHRKEIREIKAHLGHPVHPAPLDHQVLKASKEQRDGPHYPEQMAMQEQMELMGRQATKESQETAESMLNLQILSQENVVIRVNQAHRELLVIQVLPELQVHQDHKDHKVHTVSLAATVSVVRRPLHGWAMVTALLPTTTGNPTFNAKLVHYRDNINWRHVVVTKQQFSSFCCTNTRTHFHAYVNFY
jgi:hypothetical protein